MVIIIECGNTRFIHNAMVYTYELIGCENTIEVIENIIKHKTRYFLYIFLRLFHSF